MMPDIPMEVLKKHLYKFLYLYIVGYWSFLEALIPRINHCGICSSRAFEGHSTLVFELSI